MAEKVAIIYWCQGAGHAARSIPIAKEFQRKGCELVIAGGGPGESFVEMNGFNVEYDLEDIPVIDDSFTSILARGLIEVVPSALKRFGSVIGLLRSESPDKLVTDDPMTMIAASLLGKEYYRLEHTRPQFFDFPRSIPMQLVEKFSLFFGEKIFYTTLWSDEEGADGVEYIDPLAQEGDEEMAEDFEADVFLIPGSFGEEFESIREALEEQGLHVRAVGDDDWELVPAMTPYTGAADVVVCTGFSSIADSVVAGTPCIVFPSLYMQKLISDEIDKRDLEGVFTAESSEGVIEKSLEICENESEKPNYSSGASKLVSEVLDS